MTKTIQSDGRGRGHEHIMLFFVSESQCKRALLHVCIALFAPHLASHPTRPLPLPPFPTLRFCLHVYFRTRRRQTRCTPSRVSRLLPPPIANPPHPTHPPPSPSRPLPPPSLPSPPSPQILRQTRGRTSPRVPPSAAPLAQGITAAAAAAEASLLQLPVASRL
jgi:hypothetical protein